MRLEIDIQTSDYRLAVCDTLTEGFENTTVEGCKRRKAEWHTTRMLLEQICPDASITYGEQGEPILNGSNEYSHISISHGAGKVTVLLSKGDCGIDIESKKRDFSRVATRFLNKKEHEIVSPNLYPIAWSAKEAIFKFFKGRDIEFLSDFEIISIEDTQLKIEHKAKVYTVFMLDYPDYIIAFITSL